MSAGAILVWKYLISAVFLLFFLFFQKRGLRISFGDSMRIMLMAVLYSGSSICLLKGYDYVPSGVATTLLFSYPVWTALLMAVFFHQKLSFKTAVSIVFAVGGVITISGVLEGNDTGSLKGLTMELFSGLFYSIYMVVYPVMRVSRMPSIKMNFYVFFFSAIILSVYTLLSTGTIGSINSQSVLTNILLLGMVSTAMSNISLLLALRDIGSTLSATLGAFEPLTAMIVGIIVFQEPVTLMTVSGFLMIIFSILLLVMNGKPKLSGYRLKLFAKHQHTHLTMRPK